MNNENTGSKLDVDMLASNLSDISDQLESVQQKAVDNTEYSVDWVELFSKMKDIDRCILDVDQLMYLNPTSHKTNIEANLQMDRIMEDLRGLAKGLGVVFTSGGRIIYADTESTGLLDKFEPLSWQEDSKAVAMIDRLKGKFRQSGNDFDFPVLLKYDETKFGEALVGDPQQKDPRTSTKNVALFGGYGKYSVDILDALIATLDKAYRDIPTPAIHTLEEESWKQTKLHRGKGHNKLKRRK